MSGDTKLSCPEMNSDEAILWAAENGLDVVLPSSLQLLIDIDSNYDRSVFDENRDLIDACWGIEDVKETPSRSGKPGKRHLVVTLRNPVNRIERIALQAVLGSDRRREAHCLRRVFRGEKNPTLFFEKRA